MNNSLTIKAVVFGSIFGLLFCILNITIALKVGLAFGASFVAALLGFMVLSILGTYNTHENNVLQAAASGSYFSMFAMSIAIGGIALLRVELPPLYITILVSVLGALIGIIFSQVLYYPFIVKEDLPYPTGTATAGIIKSLADIGGKNFRYLIYFWVLGTVVYGLVKAGILPSILPPGYFIGLALSPLLVGFGMIIGWKACALIFLGSVYSSFFWAYTGFSASYSSHMQAPEIMTVGTVMLVMTAIVAIFKLRKMFRGSFAFFEGKKTLVILAIPFSLLLITFLIISGDIVRMLLLFAIMIPFSFICAGFVGKAIGETGVSPVTPLGLVSLIVAGILISDAKIILLIAGFVGCVGLAAATMMNTFRVGKIIETPQKHLTISQTIGAVTGVIGGCIVLYLLHMNFGFGTADLPAPISVAWSTVAESLVNGQLPSNMSPAIGCIAAVATLGIEYMKLSATCIGIGILIPPAYSCALLLGGILHQILRTKNVLTQQEIQSTAAGLILGEGIVTLVVLMMGIL
ncbi:MAG: OPT/YSL family transporter [Theionarchaea archaeon]|nr:OPT/YSL family transporter [Theionarchaea archaeon]